MSPNLVKGYECYLIIFKFFLHMDGAAVDGEGGFFERFAERRVDVAGAGDVFGAAAELFISLHHNVKGVHEGLCIFQLIGADLSPDPIAFVPDNDEIIIVFLIQFHVSDAAVVDR